MESIRVKVLYLFSGIRGGLIEKVKRGEDPGDGTWGMIRLKNFDIDAKHLELEQILPDSAAKWVRHKVLGNYGAHIPFFFNFFKYDIIFTAGGFYSQLLFTIARTIFRFRKPLWVMHDFSISGFLGNESTIKQKVFRFIVSRASGIVTVGKEEEQRLKIKFPHLAKNIVYIPFGVDIDYFKPNREIESNMVLSVGVDPDRDWQLLYDACDGLGVEVVAATRPRGNKDIAPPSFVKRQLFPLNELVEEYNRARVVVIPLDSSAGINDAMGCTALFEAMAMGKAIIATSTHTMRSYITHGENGILVPEGDVDAMRIAIKDLINDNDKRELLGKKARSYAEKNLDAQKLAGQLAEYFKLLVAKELK
jgi:glycosyltransferase involved in cell wall biosynthesis